MTNWHSYKGGRKWRRDADGRIIAEELDTLGMVESVLAPDMLGGWVYRTKGEPTTARTALDDYGAAMREASSRFGVPVPVIFAMMAIEAERVPRDKSHFDPRSVREEPGYLSDEKTPHRVSPGLMQTLISTARQANERAGVYADEPTREDLFIPARSIMLGTAYMRQQIDRVEDDERGFPADDPVLLCSAYNAGSVRETTKNDWHLLTYGGNSRIEKYIAYHNDMLAVLEG